MTHKKRRRRSDGKSPLGWHTARVAALLAASLLLASCETLSGAEGEGPDANPRDESAAQWNLASLDTARSVSYASAAEKDVILEINKARANPSLYADIYLTPLLRYFSGNDYSHPGEITIRTTEGAAAVRECIAAMKAQAPRAPLSPLEALALAARDHVKDTGPKGTVGHQGSDGSDPMTRVRRYAKNLYCGENISYGPASARSIVIQLLVDDGVPSRGHRANIMRKEYGSIGVSIGGHKIYGAMCVVDFALTP
jgi:uncharacterized protein YkwD